LGKILQKLVMVYKAKGEPEAQVVKGLLECNDIPAIITSDAAPSVHVFTIDGLGEYKIMVPETRAEEARDLIRGEEDV
jgi:hypothetical protein